MSPATEEDKKAFSFGGLDGAQAAIGLVIVASAAGRLAVLLVIVGLLITEGLGMAADDWASETAHGFREVVDMGIGTSLPIFMVGLPWLFAQGTVAIVQSALIAFFIVLGLCWMVNPRLSKVLVKMGILSGLCGLSLLANIYLPGLVH